MRAFLRDAGSADAVVPARRDDPRDRRAVAVWVGRGPAGAGDVDAVRAVAGVPDVGSEVGMGRVDAGVQHRDGHRAADARAPRFFDAGWRRAGRAATAGRYSGSFGTAAARKVRFGSTQRTPGVRRSRAAVEAHRARGGSRARSAGRLRRPRRRRAPDGALTPTSSSPGAGGFAAAGAGGNARGRREQRREDSPEEGGRGHRVPTASPGLVSEPCPAQRTNRR